MVNPYFWPAVTGSGTVTRQLSNELAAQGHEVFVLTVTHEARASEDTLDGFHVLRVPAREVSLGRLAFHYSLPFVTRPGVRRNIAQLVDQVNPDLVHLHGQFWDLCYWAGAAAKKRGMPVVTIVHTVVV